MKLNFNEGDVKYFPGVKYITMVEIKNYEPLYKDMIITIKKDIIKIKMQLLSLFNIIQEKKEINSSRRIVNIVDNEFDHNITTYKGSSGCPIIL